MKSRREIHPFKVLKSESGIAMLIALFALTLMIFIATEVSFDTSVEYIEATQQVQRIKAYYAAKAGIEISFLRIQLYKQAMVSLGDALGPQKSMLDLIWQFPMSWPPIIPEKTKVTEVDKDMIQSSVKESLMEAQYATTISPETGKLNLNDLASDVKTVQATIRLELIRIFDNEMRTNDNFRAKYGNVNFEELVNNIQDWITPGQASLNGGDKASRYQKMDLKDTNKDFVPPGRPFKTMDELHMVAGMKDDFYRMIEARATVYGLQGINVNYAPKEVLMALDPTFTEEAVKAVMKRRNDPKEGGPFPSGDQCANTFLQFVSPYGVNIRAIQDSKVILICDPEYNFRVVSTGTYQKAKREITAVTFDLDNLPGRLANLLNQQDQQQNGQATGPMSQPPAVGAPPIGAPPGGTPPANNSTKMKAPKGRPVVVYWEET
jgi:general secretion pathway protein K